MATRFEDWPLLNYIAHETFYYGGPLQLRFSFIVLYDTFPWLCTTILSNGQGFKRTRFEQQQKEEEEEHKREENIFTSCGYARLVAG